MKNEKGRIAVFCKLPFAKWNCFAGAGEAAQSAAPQRQHNINC
jgi:hypothetical protein